MQIQYLTAALYALSFAAAAPPRNNIAALSLYETPDFSTPSLEKRKGGGGGGGKGGGGRSSSTSSSSNSGGRTVSGSGTSPAYGSRYAGGAAVPYTSGARSPTRSLLPYTLPVAAVAFFPGLWLYSVYAYPYPIGYSWYENGRNRTSSVTCLCQEYSECGCDPDTDTTFIAQQLTNSTTSDGAPVNSTLVRTIEYSNGTIASFINGTLDNGTTASGGTNNPASRVVVDYLGYWAMVATVVSSVLLV